MSDSQRGPVKTATSSGESKSPENKAIAGESPTKPEKTRTAPANKGSKPLIPTKTTAPEEIIRHNISDEELEMFLNSNRDGFSETMWACVGISAGVITSVIEKVHLAFFDASKTPLTIISLIEIAMLFLSLGIASAIFFASKSKGKTTKNLIDEIRKRKRR